MLIKVGASYINPDKVIAIIPKVNPDETCYYEIDMGNKGYHISIEKDDLFKVVSAINAFNTQEVLQTGLKNIAKGVL